MIVVFQARPGDGHRSGVPSQPVGTDLRALSCHRPTRIAPGLVLAFAGGLAAALLNRLVPLVSPLLIAIVLGVAFASLRPVDAALSPGLATASRKVLRVGVALLGLQLGLGEIASLGWGVLVVVVVVVAGGVTSTVLLGRALGVAPRRALLIACGTSICGAAAVAAVDAITEADEEDVAVALALVVALGSTSMLVLPLIAMRAGLGQVEAGAWLGGSIHEVGQVVVAGGIIGAAAMQVAVLVKLGRVLMLAPVLAVLSWRLRQRATGPATGRTPVVPLFVLVFIGLVVLGSVVDLPGTVLSVVKMVQVLALASAMFALGCGIHAAALRRLRRQEVLLGVLAAVVVVLLAVPMIFAAR
jgi:uncharacterized integral membrane protein (TIGR00698 family)